MRNLVHPDQSGYIKGRYIGTNIRTIADIIDFTQEKGIEGIILLVDFEKAFDSVRWSFLKKTLNKFGFGDNFIKWIDTIYTNPESTVLNNGFTTDKFTPQRGIRQGCPISPYLFILAAELLAIHIRGNEDIQGIVINENKQVKITMLADDTTLFLADDQSLQVALGSLEEFHFCSGLKLNKTKTEAVQLGVTRDPDAIKYGVKWVEGSFKSLGITFGFNKKNVETENFTTRIDKAKNLLRIWGQRDMSIKGKIAIIKSLVIPQLLYACSVLYVPDWVIKETNNMLFKFLWSGKPEKIKRATIVGDIESGGLKMVDFESMVKALKSTWINRLLTTENGSWGHIPMYFLNELHVPLQMLVKCNYTMKSLPYNLPKFYSQVLKCYAEIHHKEPSDYDEIMEQIIWYNSFITVNGNTLFYKDWYEKGVMFVFDIVNNHNLLCNPDELCDKYGINTDNFLKHYSLRMAIPRKWKSEIIRMLHPIDRPTDTIPHVYFNSQRLNIDQLKCNHFYSMFIQKIFNKPNCIYSWMRSFTIPEHDWKFYFKLPFEITCETKLQSFQYKIVNRIFASNAQLFKWKIKPSSHCQHCDVHDDIMHYFVNCDKVIYFWDSFVRWWELIHNHKCQLILNEKDIIFGILDTTHFADALNFCILLAKWYIFRCKYLEQEIFFFTFLVELKNRLVVEKNVAMKRNCYPKFMKKWSIIYQSL